jgi:DNA-binding transcriptional LysR family regulator
MKLFVAVAEYKNIAKAAESCNIVPSAVSKRISDLEDSLGVPLLFRKSRGVELTHAGEAALKYAKNVLKQIERFEGEMSEYTEGSQGHIRVAANPSSIIQFLPKDIAEFLKLYPRVRIDLAEDVSGAILGMVRDGLVDIGITSGLVEITELETIPYRTDKLVIVAPQDHPVSVFDSMCFEETLKYSYVGLQEGSSIRKMLKEKANMLKKNILFNVSVMSFSGVIKMVEAGLGVTIMPEGAIVDLSSANNLKIINLKDDWSVRTLQIIVREKESLPLVARKLVDYLSSV